MLYYNTTKNEVVMSANDWNFEIEKVNKDEVLKQFERLSLKYPNVGYDFLNIKNVESVMAMMENANKNYEIGGHWIVECWDLFSITEDNGLGSFYGSLMWFLLKAVTLEEAVKDMAAYSISNQNNYNDIESTTF